MASNSMLRAPDLGFMAKMRQRLSLRFRALDLAFKDYDTAYNRLGKKLT